jgi:hypothetical protein
MPYIKQEQRKLVDKQIDKLAKLYEENFKGTTGPANYIITSFLLRVLRPKEGWTYESLSDIIKTLECAKLEIYRRLIALYESTKIIQNGDVKEFLYPDPNLAIERLEDQTLIHVK